MRVELRLDDGMGVVEGQFQHGLVHMYLKKVDPNLRLKFHKKDDFVMKVLHINVTLYNVDV